MATVSELRDGVRQIGERFESTFAGKDVEQLETAPVCGVWSSRDVAGHLLDWNSLLIAAARHGLGGRAPHGGVVDVQEFNDRQSEARRNEPWHVTRAGFHASLEVADQMLAKISDADLERPSDAPWGSPGTVGLAFEGLVAHINEHLDELE